ncbi:MAG: dihydropteroate synthase [Chlorobiaceae bacterium]|nr:dihydropteroate synthase [Chlorobiaceae bacterium]
MTGRTQQEGTGSIRLFLADCAGLPLDLRKGPVVMGILNTTPDSFFDGGSFNSGRQEPDLDRAFEHALDMVREGAAIIDIGGESTRPGAEKISVDEEIRRTVPLVRMLRSRTDALLSIDTYKAEVAQLALEAGANIVNDISGFTFDPELPDVCARFGAAAVLMHTPVTPQEMHWSTRTTSTAQDIVLRVTEFLSASIAIAERHGVREIIIDPGFGFGKSVEENFSLLARLKELEALGRPVLAGVSRKSFLGKAIALPGEEPPPPSERLAATIASQTAALLNGASIIRAHDVRHAVQCAAVVRAMSNEQ